MKKILNICQKDIAVIMRDKGAMLLMLLAPIALTLAMGAVTGAFSGRDSNTGISDIPVMILNRDQGQAGVGLVAGLKSQSTYLKIEEVTDEAVAREAVKADQVAAAVFIPVDFTSSMQAQAESNLTTVEVLGSSARPISVSTVQSIVSSIINRIEIIPASLGVATSQLVKVGLIEPTGQGAFMGQMATRLAQNPISSQAITVHDLSVTKSEGNINALAYLAPGMAIFFLMYTVSQASRSILDERDQGTLPRMLISPTRNSEVLAGKVLSVVVIAFLQVGVLVLASAMLFRLSWGSPLPVVLLVSGVALAASSWGILLASIAKTPYQVSSFGTALMLLFGILGGVFIQLNQAGNVMRLVGKITPHAWALDGFETLALGGSINDILFDLAGLLAMTIILFGISVIISRKRWISGFTR
jgi:linearmycin/streptolysin S transport system permease protein